MQLKRLNSVFSIQRFPHCCSLFAAPISSFLKLSFLGRGEFELTLKTGRSARFSRRGRDHRFWDWYFQNMPPIDFTEDGLVNIEWQGRSVLLRPGTQDFFIFHEISVADDYELNALGSELGTVIDLGANAGLFSSALLGKARRVISVEAVTENYWQTVRNVALAGGSAYDVWHLAVADRSGEQLRLYHNARNSGGHSVSRQWSEQSAAETDFETTESISLSDLIAKADCGTVDLLKCDIEGSEYAAFLAADVETLRQIRRIVMEVHVSETYPPALLADLIEHLSAAGFAVRLDGEVPTTNDTQARMLLADLRADEMTKAA